MTYKALYRTYRPSTFDEVAGQKHIVRTIKNALLNNKMAHAYLFCGPRGTGKTSMAKLLAKALNCEEGLGHQCNKCSNCLAVIDNSHPDVIEIDAASNNGVDEVRDLIDKVKYSPIKGKFKIYIIDEVHMMTSGAFNALLKTLEEPPAHVIFILATTEVQKILPTIVSRCQRFDFTKVDDKSLKERIIDILTIEKCEFEDEAIDTIIALADGGVRDALSILDQAIAYSGNSLKSADLREIFGLIDLTDKIAYLTNVASNNTKEALVSINQFIESGADLKRLNDDILEIVKDILIYQKTHEMSLLSRLSESDVSFLQTKIDASHCLEIIDILLKTQSEFKYVNNIQALFQVTQFKLINLFGKQMLNDISSPAPTIGPSSSSDETAIKPNLLGDKNELSDDALIKVMTTGNKELKLSLIEKWHEIENYRFDTVYTNIASILCEAKPFIVSNAVILLEFQFKHHVDVVNTISNQKTFREFIEKICNVKLAIYAISKIEVANLQNTFLELRKSNALPQVDEKFMIDIKGE